MVPTQADVLCDFQEEELHPSQTIDNCQLYINHEVQSNGLGFITITYDPTVDLTIRVSRDLDQDYTI